MFGNRIQLTNRAILGNLTLALSQARMDWVEGTAMYVDSDQASEKYGWLGDIPSMRRRDGGLNPRRPQANTYDIANDPYEATLTVYGDEYRRDKTGQVQLRISQMGLAGNRHWASMISTLMLNGASATCYDGQYFYDTDHTDGVNTTAQSNKVSVSIAGLPCQVHGSTTAPSVEEFQQVILRGVQTLFGFKSDQGELLNEDASAFLVTVPVSLFAVACTAVGAPVITAGSTNILESSGAKMGFNVTVRANGRLTWTDRFTITRTDSPMKAFIIQEEYLNPIELGPESEYFKINDKALFGVTASRGAGYGLWQMSVMMIMT